MNSHANCHALDAHENSAPRSQPLAHWYVGRSEPQDPSTSHTRVVALFGLLVALVVFHGASNTVPVTASPVAEDTHSDINIGSENEGAPLVAQAALELEMTSDARSFDDRVHAQPVHAR
jgi:hypothetical protein